MGDKLGLKIMFKGGGWFITLLLAHEAKWVIDQLDKRTPGFIIKKTDLLGGTWAILMEEVQAIHTVDPRIFDAQIPNQMTNTQTVNYATNRSGL